MMVLWIMGFVLLLILLLNWVMPSLTPETLIFGVRIPNTHVGHEQVVRARTSYYWGLALVTVASFVAIFIELALGHQGHIRPATWGIWLTLAVVVACYLNYYMTHRRLRHAKAVGDWYQGQKQALAADTSARQMKGASLLWMWPSIIVIAVGFVIGAIKYPQLPSRFAVHYNLAGQANGWADKSIFSAFGPLLIGVVLTVLMSLVLWSLNRAAVHIDPADSDEDIAHKRTFQNRLIALVWLLIAFVDLAMLFVSITTWQVWQQTTQAVSLGALIPLIGCLVFVVIIILLAVSHRRRHDKTTVAKTAIGGKATTGYVHRDDDRFWRGGAFYFNKNDPAFLVPKRFGIGWTLNMAHPLAWVIIIGLVICVVIPRLLRR